MSSLTETVIPDTLDQNERVVDWVKREIYPVLQSYMATSAKVGYNASEAMRELCKATNGRLIPTRVDAFLRSDGRIASAYNLRLLEEAFSHSDIRIWDGSAQRARCHAELGIAPAASPYADPASDNDSGSDEPQAEAQSIPDGFASAGAPVPAASKAA